MKFLHGKQISESQRKGQLDLFNALVVILNFSCNPLKLYVEYLDADKMRLSVEKKKISEIFGGKVKESLTASFNEP